VAVKYFNLSRTTTIPKTLITKKRLYILRTEFTMDYKTS